MFETNNLIYAAVVLFAIYLIHLAFFKYSAKTEKFVDYNTDVANYTQKHLDKTIEQLEEYITEYGIPDNEDNEDEEDILVKELMDAIEDRYVEAKRTIHERFDVPVTTRDLGSADARRIDPLGMR